MLYLIVGEMVDLTWAVCITQFIKCVAKKGKIRGFVEHFISFPKFIR